MAQRTITPHTAHRVAFTTSRPWADVTQDVRVQAGRPQNTHILWKPEGTDAESITYSLKSRAGPSGLFMFVEQPLSETFKHFVPQSTFCPKVTQFVVGDPITASRMYQVTPRVALLAPPRIAVIELPENRGTEIVYDLPSSIIGYENEEARVIAESVDQLLEKFVLSVL